MEFSMDFDVGIDLGTSSCCVAAFKDQGVDVIEDEEGHRTIPSYVSFTDGGILLGHAAKARAHIDPRNTIFDVLLLLGKKRSEVLHYIQRLPYEVVEIRDGRLKIKVAFGGAGSDAFFPEEILALFLSHLKQTASRFLGRPVNGAVISYPHSFNLLQLQLIRTAALVAGLTNVKLSSSSALAALAFGHQNKLYQLSTQQRELSLMVFDMGGGSTEASLVSCDGSNYCVVGSTGTFSSGGIDITSAINNYFTKELRKRSIDVSGNSSLRLKLYGECERVKKVLSGASIAHLELDTLLPGNRGTIVLTRDTFEELCEDLFMSAIEVVKGALTDVDPGKIDQCLLVGGSTRVQKIQKLVGSYFTNPINKSVNADEAVAYGGAILAANLSHRHQDPTQVGIIKHFCLTEVVGNSIGLELAEQRVQNIIPKGIKYPVSNNMIVNVPYPGSPVGLRIFEGEDMYIRGNTLIGYTQVTASQPTTQVRVTLKYNAMNTLSIEVCEQHSSVLLLKQDNICMNHSSDDIDFMKVRLVSFEEQQQKRFELMEAKNILEEYVISIKREVNDEGALVGSDAQDVLSKCQGMLDTLTDMGTQVNVEQVRTMHTTLSNFYEEKKKKRPTVERVNRTAPPPPPVYDHHNKISLTVSVLDGSIGKPAEGVRAILACGHNQLVDERIITQEPFSCHVDEDTIKSQNLRLIITGLDKYFAKRQMKTIYPRLEVSVVIDPADHDCQEWEVSVTINPYTYTVTASNRRKQT